MVYDASIRREAEPMPRACALIVSLVALTAAWPAMADDASEFGRYRQEAEAREHTAYYPLAERYAEGRGVPRDPIEAYALAEIAEHFLLATEDSDHPRAVVLKARLAAQMSADQIAAAHRRASEIRPDLERQRKLGEIRSKELGIVFLGLAFVAVIATSIGLVVRRLMFRSARSSPTSGLLPPGKHRQCGETIDRKPGRTASRSRS